MKARRRSEREKHHEHHEHHEHRERFYLLPGMGGSAYRRKRKVILRWTLITGVLASAILAWILYTMGKR